VVTPNIHHTGLRPEVHVEGNYLNRLRQSVLYRPKFSVVSSLPLWSAW